MSEQSPQKTPSQAPQPQTLPPGKQVVLAKTELQQIFGALSAAGYTIVGPTVSQEAIVY
jgi:hypothetical protein